MEFYKLCKLIDKHDSLIAMNRMVIFVRKSDKNYG